MNIPTHPAQPTQQASTRPGDGGPGRSVRSFLNAKAIGLLLVAIVVVGAFAITSAAQNTATAPSAGAKAITKHVATSNAVPTNVELEATVARDDAVAAKVALDAITEGNYQLYVEVMSELTNQGYPFIP
jgi:hypothetical protein